MTSVTIFQYIFELFYLHIMLIIIIKIEFGFW